MGIGQILVAVLAIGVASLVVLVALSNRATRRAHAAFRHEDVASALECVLDDAQRHDAFDLFLSWPVDDLYLEFIRKRCHDIVQTAPPAKAGEDLSKEGKDRIRAILQEMRERAESHGGSSQPPRGAHGGPKDLHRPDV
jgi:uncharacterized membrane protein